MKSESLKAPLGELAMRFWMIGAAVVLCSLAQTARGADEPAGKPGKKVSQTAVDVSVFAREIDQLVAYQSEFSLELEFPYYHDAFTEYQI